MPGRNAKAIFADAEMLMKPVTAHRRGRDDAAVFIVLTQHLVLIAVFPRSHAEAFRPGVGVTLAFDAKQHGGGHVLVRLGIATGLVVSNPEIEPVTGHIRFDPAITRRTAVIQRQLCVDDIGNEIGAAHRKSAHRIRFNVVARLEVIFRTREAIREGVWTIENKVQVVDDIHDIGRGRAAIKQRG